MNKNIQNYTYGLDLYLIDINYYMCVQFCLAVFSEDRYRWVWVGRSYEEYVGKVRYYGNTTTYNLSVQ